MSNLVITEQELINNPTPRCPVCLVLDTSGSMYGDKINELNKGVQLFFDAVLKDSIAKYSVEVSIVTFGGIAEKILDFGGIQSQSIPTLDADGGTPMEEAVNMALDLLEDRKKEYSKNGVDYYQPWMVLMTDGYPNSIPTYSSQRTSELVENKKLTIFPIGIGDDVAMDILKLFSPKREPVKLKDNNFKDFFSWLSQSMSTVSQSTPGDKITLDIDKMKGWMEV